MLFCGSSLQCLAGLEDGCPGSGNLDLLFCLRAAASVKSFAPGKVFAWSTEDPDRNEWHPVPRLPATLSETGHPHGRLIGAVVKRDILGADPEAAEKQRVIHCYQRNP